MLAAGAPVAAAAGRGSSPRPLGLCSLTSLLGRRSRPPAREVLHLRVRMLAVNLLEGGQQLLPLRGAESGWQPACENRPVGVARGHQASAPIRFSFSTSVVRLIRSKSAALLRL